MCLPGQTEDVLVKIPGELSCWGITYWKQMKIDSCIAPIVEALQEKGIDMRGSCCGHKRAPGHIELQDGRIIQILNGDYL
jgi:hypothetical protein